MKKINFAQHVLPHIIAVGVFLIVTIFFFNPVFFDNKSLIQGDIQQWEGSSKALRDYRDKTGEEGLWVESMFSGMPAYLVNLQWSTGPVTYLKKVLAVGLPHPVANIYLSFICFYILLLTFRVRPYLAIAGALAFGLSSYMIIGLGAGHNARIGAIAFMPLVVAGIHLAYSGKKLLGFAVTMAGMALELKENHLQITYYLLIIVLIYGLVQLIYFIREKRAAEFLKTTALLIPAVLIATGTFIGQLWGVTEYGAYTIRGKSDLAPSTTTSSGLTKEYAFDASNGILEPMMLLIPNFYGGSARHFIVQDDESKVYNALMNSGDQRTANELARYTSAYWGPQSYTVPYYAGAIIVFLFAIGIAFAEKKYVWWLVPVAFVGIIISWGSNFETLNYFLFDHVPGFNKFRSMTFAIIITLFTLPLLGMLGLEKLIELGVNDKTKKKLFIAAGVTGGLCLFLLMFAGFFSFLKESDSQLPTWFTSALAADRKGLFRSDAFRSFAFIAIAFLIIYFSLWKKLPVVFYTFLTFIILLDIVIVDSRYFTKEENYQRKRDKTIFAMTEADKEILKDESHYRVYNIEPGAFTSEARTSYFHNSLGGYHGAKIRRYQDLYDSCLLRETNEMITDLQSGRQEFQHYGIINMLNAKYIVFGSGRNNIIPNPATNGVAWFVKDVVKVNSATEELKQVCEIDTRLAAVVDGSQFTVSDVGYDSSSSIQLTEHKPNYLKYESESTQNGLVVFSEIYYPKGWTATIDGKATDILRANYVLRALAVPAGKHTIEFTFAPDAYVIGDKVTMASSWIMLLILLGSLGWTFKKSA